MCIYMQHFYMNIYKVFVYIKEMHAKTNFLSTHKKDRYKKDKKMKKVVKRNNSFNLNHLSFFSLFLVIFIAHFSYIIFNIWQTEFTFLENTFLLASKLTEVLSVPIYLTIDPNKMPDVRGKSAVALDRLIFWERQSVDAKIIYNFNFLESESFRLVDSSKLENSKLFLKYGDIYLLRKLTAPSHTSSIMYTQQYKDKYLTPPHPLSNQEIENSSEKNENIFPTPDPLNVFPYVNVTFYLSGSALSNLHTVKYMYDRLTNKQVLENLKEEIVHVIIEHKSKRLMRMEHGQLNEQKHNEFQEPYQSYNTFLPGFFFSLFSGLLNDNIEPQYIYDENQVDKSLKPVLLYIHGGGLTVMDHRSYDKLLRRHANLIRKGAVLIALDYRLAPEFRYPSALEDCIYTLNWIDKNGRNVGLDSSRIILAGDSGGGNLVASTVSVGLSSPKKYKWIQNIKAVGLIYPSVCRGCATFSNIVHGDLFQINLKASQWFDLQYEHLVGYKPNWQQSPYFAPESILANFPPTYFVLFTHDIAFDSGILYHEKLRRLGVHTGLFTAPGVHGFYGCDLWSKYGVESVEWMIARFNEHL